ncbi:MAG TPA: disulfide bond formation protein B [Rubrivivax sp.]|nr:disulfide bond formation protein B [Rubrivivax sp.]
MGTAPRRTALLAFSAFVSLAAVAVALWTQHALGMEPCPWCVLQRLVFVAIALAALPGLLWRGAAVQWLSLLLVFVLALAGVAAALWQHFVAAVSDSCNLTLAEKIIAGLRLDAVLPEIFQPRASCADAAVRLLGVPYELWSLLLLMLLGIVALRTLLRPAR